MIVCQRVSGNIIVFLLVSVRGAQPNNLTELRLTEISLAYLVNLFYETRLEML